MLENETFNSLADHATGPGAVTAIGGDHPCHPCSLAKWKTVAIVIGSSPSSASPIYLRKRSRFSISLYPGALRDTASKISQSCSVWLLKTAASCANARASFIQSGSVEIAAAGIADTAERISSIFASRPFDK